MSDRVSVEEYRRLVAQTQGQGRSKIRPRPLPRGDMNELERSRAQHLELEKRAGIILDWRWEPATWHLAPRCSIRMDWMVVWPDCVDIQDTKPLYAVKRDGQIVGYRSGAEDDAIVKIKLLAMIFWWFKVSVVFRRGTKRSPIWTAVQVPASGHAADAARVASELGGTTA